MAEPRVATATRRKTLAWAAAKTMRRMSVTPGMGRGTKELSTAEMGSRPMTPRWRKKWMKPWWAAWWAGAAAACRVRSAVADEKERPMLLI
jgi:hypothetical protein